MLRSHPRLIAFLLTTLLTVYLCVIQTARAEVLIMPIQRTIPTQPVTSLEIVAMIKSLLNGRVLSLKKKSTYTNPDCHHVKFLEDKGEFHMIQIGCFVDNLVKNP